MRDMTGYIPGTGRHPDNHERQGTNEFYAAELRLWGLTHDEYWGRFEREAPRCPACGSQFDCGCRIDPD